MTGRTGGNESNSDATDTADESEPTSSSNSTMDTNNSDDAVEHSSTTAEQQDEEGQQQSLTRDSTAHQEAQQRAQEVRLNYQLRQLMVPDDNNAGKLPSLVGGNAWALSGHGSPLQQRSSAPPSQTYPPDDEFDRRAFYRRMTRILRAALELTSNYNDRIPSRAMNRDRRQDGDHDEEDQQ